MNSQEVKAYARSCGADLVGIAARERFTTVAAERNPLEIFPECQSLIVVGRRILRGALRGVEEGTNFHSTYSTFGYGWLEDNFLSRTTYDLTCWIETHGFEAVPLFGYAEDGMPHGQPVAPGKPAPNVIIDMDFAALVAGLGEIGNGGFFLTPQYGHRQRFAAILTDCALAADPVQLPKFCTDCDACAKACPFGAIKTLPGGQPQIDYDVCRACPNGAQLGRGRGSRPDRCAAACARACLVHLEKQHVGQKFEREFRQRQPWLLDEFKRPLPARD